MIKNIKRRKSEIEAPFHHNKVVERCLAARGVKSREDMSLTLREIHPPDSMPGINTAAERVICAIEKGEKILIVGDYDADGATASALLLRFFRMMGYDNTGFIVPNRFEYGYGLSHELVPEIIETGANLVITVDNGISSVQGVDACNKAGIDVIVTDHHLPGENLPNALSIVNPNLPESKFPSKNLAGVGVAFYLAGRIMRMAKNKQLLKSQSVNIKQLLDLVALGTMADLVPLDKNNRILIKAGIEQVRNGKGCQGIKALISVSGKKESSLTEECFSYYLAPRLNAAGRLKDMSIGIQMLISDDPETCKNLAETLDEINKERKSIQFEMQRIANGVVTVLKERKKLPPGLVLFHKDWHQGIVGLIAGKVKEQINRPVVVFAPEKQGLLKGSCRSVKGIHIKDALAAIDSQNPGLIDKFGGHAMAAGLSLREDKIIPFTKAFVDYMECKKDHISEEILTDGRLDETDIGIELAEAIVEAGPWGQGFPYPVFDNAFEIVEKREVGTGHTKLRLRLPSGFHVYNAIFFNKHPSELPAETKVAHFVYEVTINEYRGIKKSQLMIKHCFRMQA